jgi:hypothetical protein
LEANCFRFSRSKVKYKSDFSATTQNEGDVRIDGQVVPEKDIFRCLGSMLQKDGDIDEDVSHKIKVDRLKWRQASGVLLLSAKTHRRTVTPRSEVAETKPPYMCSGCLIHTYSNNMINKCHI